MNCQEVFANINILSKQNQEVDYNQEDIQVKENNPYIKSQFFKLEEDSQEKLILALILDFEENTYTYAPNYEKYPTQFNIDNLNYILYYTQVEKSYDSLTKENLELYKGKNLYFLLFDEENLEDIYKNSFNLDISLLLCSDINCTPYKDTISINLPKIAEIENFENSSLYNKFQNMQSINIESNLKKEDNSNLNQHVIAFNFMPQDYSSSMEVKSFALALLLGLMAGFILNLMPCVLPVIAIKIASLVQASNHDEHKRDILIRTHSFYFALGILSLFAVLALFFGFFEMMWGAIFQNVYFVIILTGLIFMFGLSLTGLFSLPILNIRTPQTSSLRLNSYLQGLFATLLATPCSGPLLGGVLGFSLTLPLHLLLLLFFATGFGMALPYFILCVRPSLIRFIPKSGNWTLIMEKALAYMLFATSLYLLSILPEDMLYKTLIYLFFISFFLWLFTFAERSKHAILWGIFLFSIHSFCSYTIFKPLEENYSLVWHEYNSQDFMQNLGNKAMLVNFTADWCPTCKLIEKTVLSYENIQNLVKKYDLILVKVDLTYANEENEALLKSLQSASIPLVAFFPEGIFAYSPILLRDIFTFKQLESVLEMY